MTLIKQLNEDLRIEKEIDNAFEQDLESGALDNLIDAALKEYDDGMLD